MTITLRPYQKEGLDAIWSYFNNGGTGNPCLVWPCGTGKSIVPAIFIKAVMDIWPTQRFLLMSHVKELLVQDGNALRKIWPNAPLGYYSSGLREKNPYLPICYAGIQSAIKNPSVFGWRDIIFIDEAHLINQDDASMYLTFIATMKLINPHVKVIGLTATPFRLGQGMITDGGLFTDIIHDLCSMENFNKMIEDGYISPLIPLRTKVSLNIESVGISKGDFIQSQLQHAVDVAEVTYQGLREAVIAGEDRKSWLIFSSGIEHAEHISSMLAQFGISCVAVHSKNSMEFNDKAIEAYKNNEIRALVNYGKLTTGFDKPSIDLILMFRPTMSVSLWCQMLGRGVRIAPDKKNCLVLDYAKNTTRLGPINDPVIPRKKGEASGDIPIKLCEHCGAFNHIKVKWCVNCNTEFSFEIKITKTSGTHELIKSDLPVIEELAVEKAYYQKHEKIGKSPMLKVTYVCGLQQFSKYLFPQNLGGLPRHQFHVWWRQRHEIPPPATVDECLKYTAECKIPRAINVWLNKKYPSIEGEIF